MLLELRALGDAVLIGSRTLRAEGYARLVRARRGGSGGARRGWRRTRSRC